MSKSNNFFLVIGLAIACCLPLYAQAPKPGLWDVTSKMTWQQSPFPPGMQNPMGGGDRTSQACITQEQIDKFGTPAGSMPRMCRITNVNKGSDSISADVECDAPLNGKGTFQQKWTDSEHSSGKVHFTGTLPNGKPMEWTIDTTSVFKSSDCGSVKPVGH